MKILLAHSDPKLPARESIDLWRIIRPFRELEKHVDWQIDHVPYLIPDELFDENANVKPDELIKHIETLKDYDIIWTSYFPDAILFDVMAFAQEKYGTKFVLDVDDDMYHIPEDNGMWQSTGLKGIKELQWMIAEASYVVASSEILKAEFAKHRSGATYVLPNYVGSDYSHKPFDNGDKLVIGYFGSITHKKDLFNTGFFDAIQQIMHKYKHVHVGTVGIPINAYLPKSRYTFHPGKPGQAWLDEVWPNINIDIAVAPLEDTQFNSCKTNIKWLESALIPSAFIGSNVSPYKDSVVRGKTGLLTDNSSEGWFEALESLVMNKTLRKKLTANALKEVTTNWAIESKWPVLKDIIEAIYNDKRA